MPELRVMWEIAILAGHGKRFARPKAQGNARTAAPVRLSASMAKKSGILCASARQNVCLGGENSGADILNMHAILEERSKMAQICHLGVELQDGTDVPSWSGGTRWHKGAILEWRYKMAHTCHLEVEVQDGTKLPRWSRRTIAAELARSFTWNRQIVGTTL